MKPLPHPLELSGDGLLGGLTHQTFLSRYWQQQPVLIRNALPNYKSPISADELAGLACEPEVESRLVMEKGGPTPWYLEHGPFEESRFSLLPTSHWSLLVQGCEKYVPELAALLQQFDFIPHWRMDDIMVSYAPDQGSVGPHVDQYDVFLIQAQGTRRWQISTAPTAADNFIDGIDLNILRDFKPEQEWVVQPGDILYLPPGVAHFGLALEDCLTLSVGFRAPAHADLIGGYLEHVLSHINPKARYSDPALIRQTHAGEISNSTLDQVRRIVRQAVANEADIDDWFSRYVTEPKVDHFSQDENRLLVAELSPAAFTETLKTSGYLERHPDCRFAFRRHTDGTSLYIHGERFQLSPELNKAAALLADHQHVDYEQLAEYLDNGAFIELLTELYNRGYISLPKTEYQLHRVTWREAEKQLRALRTLVFIHEQKVPAELEWDGEDERAEHLLAVTNAGQTIGTVRLLKDGHIGRLAVVPKWRNKGVGRALMLAALKLARARGVNTCVLNAQTRVIDFYRRLGFSVDSEEFMDAGIPHRRMLLELPAETAQLMTDHDNVSEYAHYQLGQDSGPLSLSLRDQHIKLCQQMAQQATRSLHIFSYSLDASVFDSLPFLEAVKQLAISSTNSKIYILLQEPKEIVLHGHRIVELARRLSSHILIHRADEDDKKRLDNFIIADQIGVIRRPHSNRYEAIADFNNARDARLLLKFFEEAWVRSQPEPELRRLHL